MLTGGRKTESSEVMLVAHMNSWSVSVNIVRMESGLRPRILWSRTRQCAVRFRTYQIREREAELIEIFEELMLVARSAKSVVPTRAMIFLGDPWVHSEYRVIESNSKTPKQVTKKVLDELLAKDYKALLRSIDTQFAGHEPVELLDRKTIELSLNGYPVPHVRRVMAQSVSCTTLWSVASARFLSEIRHVVRTTVPSAACEVHSIASALVMTTDSLAPEHSALVVHVGGMTTELFIRTGRGLRARASVPGGAHELLKTFAARAGGNTLDDISSLMRLSRQKLLADSVIRSIEQAERESASAWQKTVERSYSKLIAHGAFPEAVFVVAPALVDTMIRKALSQSVYMKELHGSHPPILSFLRDILPGYIIVEDDQLDTGSLVCVYAAAHMHVAHTS